MKKIIVFVITLLCAAGIYAQNVNNDSASVKTNDFKSGNNSIEILFTPFKSDGTTFNLTDFGFRYRRFFGQNALRAGLGINYCGNKDGLKEVATVNDSIDWVGTKNYYTHDKSTTIKIALGYERHFNVGDRTAVYVGGEFGYAATINQVKHWKNDDYYEVYHMTSVQSAAYKNKQNYTVTDPTANTIIIAALAGIDFHVYKGLYLGAELGIKYGCTFYTTDEQKINGTDMYSVTKNGNTMTVNTEYNGTDYKTSTTVNNTVTVTESSDKHVKTTYTGLQSNFCFYVEPAIRIGWRF